MPLTPDQVAAKRFSVTRFRPGYAEEEVDAFLDEVEAELRRLLQEKAELQRGTPARAPAGPAAAAGSLAPAPEPAPEPSPPAPGEGQEAALRTLLLAQRTADEAVAEARREADAIVTAARERASTLERETRERHASRLADLQREQDALARQVAQLQEFESGHRSRLRSYLQEQLRELDSRAPVVGKPPELAPPASRVAVPSTPAARETGAGQAGAGGQARARGQAGAGGQAGTGGQPPPGPGSVPGRAGGSLHEAGEGAGPSGRHPVVEDLGAGTDPVQPAGRDPLSPTDTGPDRPPAGPEQ